MEDDTGNFVVRQKTRVVLAPLLPACHPSRNSMQQHDQAWRIQRVSHLAKLSLNYQAQLVNRLGSCSLQAKAPRFLQPQSSVACRSFPHSRVASPYSEFTPGSSTSARTPGVTCLTGCLGWRPRIANRSVNGNWYCVGLGDSHNSTRICAAS